MTAKFITALISPLGTALLLGVLALVLALMARRKALLRLRLVAGVLAVAWLWGWSTPLVSDALRGWIENQAGSRVMDELPSTAVMVVLGGGVSGPRPPARPYPDLGAAADRVWYAARLFHAGKAGRILLSGGVARGGDGSEAEAMRTFLLDLGVPAAAVVLEPASSNSAANAENTAALLAKEGIGEVLLVTSALHMPRARRLFQKAGLTVVPAPTDFEVVPMPFDMLRLLPDAGALERSARGMKELVGLLVVSR